jgi:hypothetical protein
MRLITKLCLYLMKKPVASHFLYDFNFLTKLVCSIQRVKFLSMHAWSGSILCPGMGKYHCTIDLLFDWFGLLCFANKNKNCQLSYS